MAGICKASVNAKEIHLSCLGNASLKKNFLIIVVVLLISLFLIGGYHQ